MKPEGIIAVRMVAVERIIELRHRVLRGGLPRSTAFFAGDDHADTVHLAALLGENVIGCATVLRNDHELFQLRGMAVDPAHQRRGVGRILLAEAERHCARAGGKAIWGNCRAPAVAFYEALGWAKQSEEFVIETAGPHFKMGKSLSGDSITPPTGVSSGSCSDWLDRRHR